MVENKLRRNFILSIITLILSIVLVVGIIVCIIAAVGIRITLNPRLTVISGNSMKPTLENGDYILTIGSELTYSPKMNDIVVIHGDFEGDEFDYPLVKKVIATGGQTVRIEFEESDLLNARVYVDGVLTESDAAYYDSNHGSAFISSLAQYEYHYFGYRPDGTRTQNYNEYYNFNTKVYERTVPEGTIFIMGDNRYNSADSRISEIDCVPEEYIIGKAVLRLFPLSKFGNLYD